MIGDASLGIFLEIAEHTKASRALHFVHVAERQTFASFQRDELPIDSFLVDETEDGQWSLLGTKGFHISMVHRWFAFRFQMEGRELGSSSSRREAPL